MSEERTYGREEWTLDELNKLGETEQDLVAHLRELQAQLARSEARSGELTDAEINTLWNKTATYDLFTGQPNIMAFARAIEQRSASQGQQAAITRAEIIRKADDYGWQGMTNEQAGFVLSCIAPQPVAVPEGWQLVPKEATREMKDAMLTSFHLGESVGHLYEAALDAAMKASHD